VHKFWSAMAINLGKRAVLVGIVVALVTIGLGLGLSRLDFATGQDSYLNEGSEVYENNQNYQDLFGGQAMLTLFTMNEGNTIDDFFTDRNIEQLREIEKELLAECQLRGLHPDVEDVEPGQPRCTPEEAAQGTPGILTVVSPVTAMLFTEAMITTTPPTEDEPRGTEAENPALSIAGDVLLTAAANEDPDSEAAVIRGEESAETLNRFGAVEGDHEIGNPQWREFLLFDNRDEVRAALRPFFPNPTNAVLLVRLEGNLSIEDEGTAAQAVEEAFADRTWDNATAITTGAPVLLRDLNDYLRGGMLTLGALAAGLMVLILLLTFRVRWRLLPLGIILIGVIWAFGLAGYLGIPLSVVTISGLPVLLGIGIDFAIQMHSRIEEEVQLDRAPHPIQETTTNLAPALVIATIAGAIAFLALLLAEVPMIRHFGILLAIGIVVVLVADVLLTTAVLGAREYRSPTPIRDYTRDRLSRLVVVLGSLPRAAVPFLVATSVIVFVVGISLEDRLELQTDPEQWANQDTQVIRDLEVLRNETQSSAELGVFVQSDDLFSDATVEWVHDFTFRQLDRWGDDLLSASGIVTTVSYVMDAPGATQFAPTGEQVANAYAVAPEPVRFATVDAAGDAGALNIIFRAGPASLEDRAVYVNDIRDSIETPQGVQATPSGLAVVGVGLLENLRGNRILLTYVALAAVFVFLTLRFLSPIRGLLAMIPVLMGVGASTIVAFTAGFKLSPLTALGGPLVIAACTEFTTLILTRYMEERRRGLTPKEATEVASARTGRAFVASALATIAGVGVLASSGLPLLRDFGFIVTINVSVALLSALVVLPPLIVWADRRGWVHKGGPIPVRSDEGVSERQAITVPD
jgi:uncharacterized protein